MTRKIKVGSGGIVTLNDKCYLAAGGEGEIYVNSGMAYKLYHDPATKMLPLKKMQELSLISDSHVIVPQDIIYDVQSGKPLGYTTKFIDDVEPLLKLFTKTFKNDNNISFQMINHLVKEMQMVTTAVHAAQCLLVDYNELNVLVRIGTNDLLPFYIDTDSYSTPSFKATAIMDSVRDRKSSVVDKNGILHYNPTIESDWFSWAVLAFWIYSNVHPYRGRHANYKPNEKAKQMDDGISVFHKGVGVPPCVNDFKVIPGRHLDYFKRVFLNNERGVPPMPDSSVPMLVPTQVITIQGTDKLSVQEIAAYDSHILAVTSIMGVYYIATKTNIYANKKEIGKHNAKKILLCSASDGTLITAQQDNSGKIAFRELTKADPCGTASSTEMFARNNAFYTIGKSKLIENSFTAFGNKMVHRVKEIENLSAISTKMFDGVVIQNLLGRYYLTLPYKLGSCFSKHVPVLDGYRVIEAKGDKNVVVVIAEKNGRFDEFIIVFSKDYSTSDVRKIEDVTFNTINFAVGDNGLCLLLVDDRLEVFASAQQVQVIDNPPFDATMKLFATSDGFFFTNGNSFHQVKRK